MTLELRVKVSHTEDLFAARNANSMVFIFGTILPMVCILHRKFWVTEIIVESKVKYV